MRFSYYLPVNIVFGTGVTDQIADHIKKYLGTDLHKVLLVTGRNSTKKSGLLDRVKKLLAEGGLDSVLFDRVDPNPTTDSVYDGAKIAKNEKCDLVLALGGGSIMDAAKAIAFSVKNDGDLMDYIYGRRSPGDALPIALMPTTSGTGSEGNSFAVITDPKTGDKKSLRCPATLAKLSLIDPDLMKTMPQKVLAEVGFDALCHSMEAYISALAQPITNYWALEAIKLINQSLIPLFHGQNSPEDWEKLTWASTLGGMCIGLAGVCAPHGLEHPVSGLKNAVHGRGLAALTPVIYERTLSQKPGHFTEISRILGGQSENDLVIILKKLIKELELDQNLSDMGIRDQDVDWMAENTLKVSSAALQNHPIVFSNTEIKEIFRACL